MIQVPMILHLHNRFIFITDIAHFHNVLPFVLSRPLLDSLDCYVVVFMARSRRSVLSCISCSYLYHYLVVSLPVNLFIAVVSSGSCLCCTALVSKAVVLSQYVALFVEHRALFSFCLARVYLLSFRHTSAAAFPIMLVALCRNNCPLLSSHSRARCRHVSPILISRSVHAPTARSGGMNDS